MPKIKYAEVAVGGYLADHWLGIYYVGTKLDNINILDAYMLHGNKRRHIEISDRIHQIVLDGLYGYLPNHI